MGGLFSVCKSICCQDDEESGDLLQCMFCSKLFYFKNRSTHPCFDPNSKPSDDKKILDTIDEKSKLKPSRGYQPSTCFCRGKNLGGPTSCMCCQQIYPHSCDSVHACKKTQAYSNNYSTFEPLSGSNNYSTFEP